MFNLLNKLFCNKNKNKSFKKNDVFFNKVFVKHTNKNNFYNLTITGIFKNYFKNFYNVSPFARFKAYINNNKQTRTNNWRYYVKGIFRFLWRSCNSIFRNNRLGLWLNYKTCADIEGLKTVCRWFNKPRHKRKRMTFKRYSRTLSPFNRFSRQYLRRPHKEQTCYKYLWKGKSQKYGKTLHQKMFFYEAQSMAKKQVSRRFDFFGKIKREITLEKYKWSFFTEYRVINVYIPKFKRKERRLKFIKFFKYFIAVTFIINFTTALVELWSEYTINRRESKNHLILYNRITWREIERFFFRIDYYIKRSSQFFFIFYFIAYFVRVCGGKPIFKNPTNNLIDLIQTVLSFCWIKLKRRLRTSFIDIRNDIKELYSFKDIYYILIPVALCRYIMYFYFLTFILQTESFYEFNIFHKAGAISLQELYLFDLHYRAHTDYYTSIEEMNWENIVNPTTWHCKADTFELFQMGDIYDSVKQLDYIHYNPKNNKYCRNIHRFGLWVNWNHEWYQKYYVTYFPNLNWIIRNFRTVYWELIFVMLVAASIYSNTSSTKFHTMRSVYKTMYNIGDCEFYKFEYRHNFHEIPTSFDKKIYEFFNNLIIQPLYWFFYKIVKRFFFSLHLQKIKIIFFRSLTYVRFFRRKFKTVFQISWTTSTYINQYIMKGKSQFQKDLRIILFNSSVIKRSKKVDWIIFTRDGEDIDDDFLWWNCNNLTWDEERQNVLR